MFLNSTTYKKDFMRMVVLLLFNHYCYQETL